VCRASSLLYRSCDLSCVLVRAYVLVCAVVISSSVCCGHILHCTTSTAPPPPPSGLPQRLSPIRNNSSCDPSSGVHLLLFHMDGNSTVLSSSASSVCVCVCVILPVYLVSALVRVSSGIAYVSCLNSTLSDMLSGDLPVVSLLVCFSDQH
jgi:hypothetical protein